MRVETQKMNTSQAYEARGVVAKMVKVGEYEAGPILKIPVYKFLTLDAGPGKQGIPVELVGPAPCMEENGEVFLDTNALKEGDYVVHPGLVYRKCMWSDRLMAEHMKALQGYVRKDIIKADKADAPAIDLGEFDHTADQVTKQ